MDQNELLAEALRQASPRIDELKGKAIVVKVGGSTLGSHDTTLEDVAALSKLGVKVVVVHGGGASISHWLKVIGKEPRFVDGLRVTDAETMEIVTMVLAGKVNKEIVTSLAKLGGRAVGVCGVDGGLIRARRLSDDLGLVGEVTDVDLHAVQALLAAGCVPIIAPIALGEQEESLNINADTAAAEIAVSLGAEKIIFLTDVAGIRDQDGSVLPRLTKQQAQALIDSGVISGGMIPKAHACFRALDRINEAQIVDGRVAHALIRELLTDSGVGTRIRG
ncbi:MAG: acetylglutamate kinase [Chloroflexi bacterium]|nr:acetylglutamate kinase [Chloroflexota bacterium]MDA8187656.1 acetylglutamate kinase [Dehalococcoidales bacterium]